MTLIVKKTIKERCEDMAVSGNFYGALETEIEKILSEAQRRAKANGRKTILARDL